MNRYFVAGNRVLESFDSIGTCSRFKLWRIGNSKAIGWEK
jgi:hypothetical protein